MAATYLSKALRKVARSGKIPTTLSSKEIMKIDAQLRERSIFSARVANTEILDEISSITRAVVRGEMTPAAARRQLGTFIRAEGYEPEPGEEGTIKDLTSKARLNLIVDTNARMAKGYAKRVESMANLEDRPWQELYRQYRRKQPRDWVTRWRQAGGRLMGGRFLAPVTSPIWAGISAFGLPYPPFDFNSGMGVRTLPNSKVGKKAPKQKPQRIQEFNDGLQSELTTKDPKLRRQLLRDLGPGYTTRGGILRKKKS